MDADGPDVLAAPGRTGHVVGSPELRRAGADRWIVRDHAPPPGVARHDIARVREVDGGSVEVVWLDGDIPLPTTYLTPDDVIDDLVRWRSGRSGATRPIEIPHHRPLEG